MLKVLPKFTIYLYPATGKKKMLCFFNFIQVSGKKQSTSIYSHASRWSVDKPYSLCLIKLANSLSPLPNTQNTFFSATPSCTGKHSSGFALLSTTTSFWRLKTESKQFNHSSSIAKLFHLRFPPPSNFVTQAGSVSISLPQQIQGQTFAHFLGTGGSRHLTVSSKWQNWPGRLLRAFPWAIRKNAVESSSAEKALNDMVHPTCLVSHKDSAKGLARQDDPL